MTVETFADFCAGIGGFRLGLEDLGLRCVYACEHDKDCVATYNANFSADHAPEDILSVVPARLPDFDILCAGFPCQPFSLAGKKLGLEDERSRVLPQLLKIIAAKKPKVVLLENVENFRAFGGGSLLEATLKALDEAGYIGFSDVLDASRFGVPQQRRRLFIVAFRREVGIQAFRFPTGSALQTPFRPFLAAGDCSIPITGRWQEYIDFYGGKKALHELSFTPPKTRLGIEKAHAGIDLGDCIYQMRSSGIRALSLDRPLPTLAVSISGGGAMIPVYSKERRHLNLTEIRRVMGFPDSFQFPVSRTSAIKQLANAVSPPVAKAIGAAIMAAAARGDGAPSAFPSALPTRFQRAPSHGYRS